MHLLKEVRYQEMVIREATARGEGFGYETSRYWQVKALD
jgi:hypothetical protein